MQNFKHKGQSIQVERSIASENLTPYEGSVAQGTNPFTIQTAGGDSDIGNSANLKELRGKSYVLNQRLANGNFENKNAWSVYLSSETSFNVSNNEATITASGTQDSGASFLHSFVLHIPVGNKVLFTFTAKSSINGNKDIFIEGQSNYGNDKHKIVSLTSEYQTFSDIFVIKSQDYCNLRLFYNGFGTAGEVINVKNVMVIDLTEMFGAGNEPTTVEQFKSMFPKPYYAYNAGEIISSKSTAIVNYGYNLFDIEHPTTVFPVVGGIAYTIENTDAGAIEEYDADGNLLKTTNVTSIPLSEAGFHVITLDSSTSGIKVTGYNSETCFHTTWDESRTGFEPYDKSTVTLPNIELRSVPDYTNGGEIYDVAYQNGGGLRRIGIVDLGSYNWTKRNDYKFFYCDTDNSKRKKPNNAHIANILCNGLIPDTYANVQGNVTEKTISINSAGRIAIYMGSTYFDNTTEIQFKTAMGGIYLIYQLDDGKEEEISTSENPGWEADQPIDDFGLQQFTSAQTIQVPQGNLFEYAVDYKAFVDSLGYRFNYNPDSVGDQFEIDELKEVKMDKDGSAPNAKVGNLISDTDRKFINDFAFGTGDVDTIDGEAEVSSIRGKTEWTGTTPSYVNVVSNKSVMFNLFNPTAGYAHVVESDEENNGLCVYGTGLAVGAIMEFSETSDFASVTEIALFDDINTTSQHYLHCLVPSDGYIRTKNTAPSDLCISNVWGGNRVTQHFPYEEAVVELNTVTYFANGMKGINVGGENVVYDEMLSDVYYTRVLTKEFGASPSVSYVNATGSYNIYRLSVSNALSKGACEIGGSTKFTWIDVGQIGTSTPINTDCMSMYTNYIYFTIAQSEDTTYTYSEDTEVVDAASFETQSAIHTLYTLSGTDYIEATEYTEGETYYYISETNLHGLNGKAINDEIANKILVYQRYSMDKTVYTGTAISPALNWKYKIGDFGTEELTLASGFPVVPSWVVYYPINVLETVQRLHENYVSLESAENMLHQVGELQGFDFDSISVDEETGNMKVNGLVDTKETIITIAFSRAGWNTTVDETTKAQLKELFNELRNRFFTDFNFYNNHQVTKPFPPIMFLCLSPNSVQVYMSQTYLFSKRLSGGNGMCVDVIFGYNFKSQPFNLHYNENDDNFSVREL